MQYTAYEYSQKQLTTSGYQLTTYTLCLSALVAINSQVKKQLTNAEKTGIRVSNMTNVSKQSILSFLGNKTRIAIIIAIIIIGAAP
jgi:hypothetical protein